MTEIFELLCNACRKCGMSVFTFWECTYGEIIDFLNDYKEQKRQDLKEQTVQSYQLALMMSVFVNRTNNGNQPPTLQEIYPDLFEDDEITEGFDNGWILQKEQLLDFAEEHNKMIEKEAKE